jgi:hypothetical protein
MIVVASHDRVDLLELMLKRLNEINLNGHNVLIVDTNSSNTEYQNRFNELQIQYSNFTFDKLNYTCWDSGAYIHAYKNYPSENYIFLQDSLDITERNIIPIFDNFLKVYDVVPVFNFGYGYESEEQKIFTEQNLPITSLPTWAIFGPIFAVRRETLDKLPKEWIIHPTNKVQGCGMERRWSLMFHLINASKHYLELENFKKDHTIFTSKRYINKQFFYRP